MPRIKKTVSEQEKVLLGIIADAKKKLSKMQEKQKMQLQILLTNMV